MKIKEDNLLKFLLRSVKHKISRPLIRREMKYNRREAYYKGMYSWTYDSRKPFCPKLKMRKYRLKTSKRYYDFMNRRFLNKLPVRLFRNPFKESKNTFGGK